MSTQKTPRNPNVKTQLDGIEPVEVKPAAKSKAGWREKLPGKAKKS